MQIEAGKRYYARGGDVVGPMTLRQGHSLENFYPWTDLALGQHDVDHTWMPNGSLISATFRSNRDLVAVVTDEDEIALKMATLTKLESYVETTDGMKLTGDAADEVLARKIDERDDYEETVWSDDYIKVAMSPGARYVRFSVSVDPSDPPITVTGLPFTAPPRLDAKPEYQALAHVLDDALAQAQGGKGSERHTSRPTPFLEQPIIEIGRMIDGTGGHAYQIIKKTQEAQRMALRGRYQAAVKDLLGAINYAAAMILLIGEIETEAGAPDYQGPHAKPAA